MNVGLVAHDSKKKLMQNFCIAYRGILNKHNLFATGTTGRLIEDVANLSIHKFLAGHLGGMQQMAAMIDTMTVDEPPRPEPGGASDCRNILNPSVMLK